MNSPVSVDLSDSANKIITNLAGPSTKTIGEVFGDLLYLCLNGISLAADKKRLKYAYSLDVFKNNLTTKVGAIPKEKLVEPDTHEILSALDDAKFCVDHEELRTLFENLIASSLSSDTAEFVHPSFSNIIRRLSILDAKVIDLFAANFAYPIVEYRVIFEDNTYHIKQTNVFLPEVGHSTYKDKAASLLYLSSLGLLKVSYDSHISTAGTYNAFFETSIYHEINELYEKFKTISELTSIYKEVPQLQNNPELNVLDKLSKKVKRTDVIRGRCDLTELGFNFLRACGYSLQTK